MASSTQFQLRKNTAAANQTFTGAQAEVTVDTDTHRLRVHDATTPGGHQVPLLDEAPIDGLTVVALGDSRTAQWAVDNTLQTGVYSTLSAQSCWSWMQGMLGHPFRLLLNLGKSGDTSTQMLARLPQAVAARPAIFYMKGAVNGIAATTITNQAGALAAAQVELNNFATAYTQMHAVGALCVFVNEPGNGTFGPLSMNAVQYFNNMLENFCRQNKGCIYVNAARVLRDSTLTANFLPYPTTGDQLHNLPTGGYKEGAEMARVLAPYAPPIVMRHQGALDEFAWNPQQIVDNGLFRTTTGGTTSTNGVTASAGVPAGWRVSNENTGSTTIVSTLPHTVPHLDANGLHDAAGAPSGFGNWLRLQSTGAAASDMASALFAIPVARLSPGDTVSGEMEIMALNAVGLIGVECFIAINATLAGVATSYAAYDFYAENVNYGVGPGNFRVLARTPEKQIPAGVTSINSATIYARLVYGPNNTTRTADVYIGLVRALKR